MEQSDQAISANPDQTAPDGAVWSGFILLFLSITTSHLPHHIVEDLFESLDKYDELLCPNIYGKYCIAQNIYTLIKILQSWVFDTTWRPEKLHLIHVRQVFLRTQKLVDLHHQNSISTLNTNYSFSFHIAHRSVTEYLLIVKNNKCCRCRIKTLKTGPSHKPWLT